VVRPGDAPAAQERQWRQASVVAQVHVVRRAQGLRGSVARRGPTVRKHRVPGSGQAQAAGEVVRRGVETEKSAADVVQQAAIAAH